MFVMIVYYFFDVVVVGGGFVGKMVVFVLIQFGYKIVLFVQLVMLCFVDFVFDMCVYVLLFSLQVLFEWLWVWQVFDYSWFVFVYDMCVYGDVYVELYFFVYQVFVLQFVWIVELLLVEVLFDVVLCFQLNLMWFDVCVQGFDVCDDVVVFILLLGQVFEVDFVVGVDGVYLWVCF